MTWGRSPAGALALAVLGVAALAGPAGAAAGGVDGAALYAAKCATCHGTRGDGQGAAALLLYPRPRNFMKGSYRLRSTPSGQLPTDDDLTHTITNGIPGTSMPAWRAELTGAEVSALVAVVKGFNPRFARGPAPRPIEIPAPPAETPELVAEGRKVYVRMGCASCHGDAGRGDGTASATLKDEAGLAIVPYDFTLPGRMKGGLRPEDVYRAFTTGLDGTPMPEFAGQLKPDERWQLVHYVRSLARPAPPEPAAAGPIRAAAVASVPEEPLDPAWDAAAPALVPLRPVWSRSDVPTRLLVRALRSAGELGLLVEWTDATKNERALAVQDFRDALAVQFPVAPSSGPTSARPFLAMGDRNNPVNIWQWKADRQVDRTRFASARERYPDMFAMNQQDVEADRTFYTAWAAGNVVSRRESASPVEDLDAAGFGTLTAQPAASQQVEGRGVFGARTWRVALRRALTTSDAGDVQLGGTRQVPVAFSVWDGSKADRGGQKAFSAWEVLELVP